MATLEQKAPAVASGAKARVYKNFIGGEWVESHTGETFDNLNPADTREVVGVFQAGGPGMRITLGAPGSAIGWPNLGSLTRRQGMVLVEVHATSRNGRRGNGK